jgi:hypothetical protein
MTNLKFKNQPYNTSANAQQECIKTNSTKIEIYKRCCLHLAGLGLENEHNTREKYIV